ncbi:MAG TPA: nuclear transport factor 2 family protein [Terriglobales bacterium]|jgi:hypothetical protein|nr:nuclear transport factor 2 family protein [Terriglobales bacterium]
MRSIPVLLLVSAVSTTALAQAKAAPKATKAGGEPQALIQSLWENFKNKNTKAFEAGLTSNAFMADSRGVIGKDKIMSDLQACMINSYSLSDFKQEAAGKDAMVVTYRARQDGSCGSEKLPRELVASDVLVKQGGKWKSLYHQETALTQAAQ